MSSNFLEDCRRVMLENGLAPAELLADGELHRCPTNDKPQGKDGAYVIHIDVPFSLWWCNHRTGEDGTHTAKNEGKMNKEERQAFNARVAKEKEQREKDRQERQTEAARKAQYILSQAPKADDTHPYLLRKRVPSFGLFLGRNNELIMPIMGADGKEQSLQFIPAEEDKKKRLLTGGKKTEGFFPIPAKDGTLCIAEGYATAASIHLATGFACLVAIDANNLQAVAHIARANHPERTIILCADNDPKEGTTQNVGIEKATKAAQSINGLIAVCPLINGRKADFNDLHVAQGLDAVKAVIEAATMPEVSIVPESPLPLRAKPQEQMPYPVEALGTFGEVVRVVAEHVAAPLPMVAASLLSSLSLCSQRLANVVHEGRVVQLSLYFLTIAGSGERKSTIDDIMTAAIRAHEETEYQAYKEALRFWNIEIRAHEVAKKNAEKAKDLASIKQGLLDLGAEPEKPISPRMLFSNVNVEGLYRMYLEGVTSLGLFSDEAGTFFGGTSFANENKLKSIAFFASLWSNGRADKVRMGEGDSHITGKRLAAHLMLQPIIAEGLLADELLQQQGFFPRFLMTASKSLKGTRLKNGTPSADIREHKAVQAFNHVCHTLLLQSMPMDAQGVPQLRAIPLSSEAEVIYRKLYNSTEEQQAEHGELAHVSNYASRCAEQAQRIAGVLSLAQDPTTQSIQGDTMAQAAQIALWYLAEAKRLTEDSGVSSEIVRAEKLLKWLQTNGERFVPLRKMAQYVRLKDTSEVKAALKLLEEHGYVKAAPKGIMVNGAVCNTAWEVVVC